MQDRFLPEPVLARTGKGRLKSEGVATLNTFVAIIKTLLDDTLKGMAADQAHILRSIAGHIVAGTATDIERRQLDSMLVVLEE